MKRTTKLLALLLSMLMIVLSMPFAISAADTITLSKDKVIITRPINPIKREDLMNGAADDSFSIYAVSDTEIVTENGDYHLELGVDYTGDETVNFDWLRCDENGNIPEYRTDVYLGNKSYLDWYIPLENQTDYIKGVVSINKVSKQIVFKVTYTPKDNYEEEIIPDTIYNLVPVGDLDVRVYDSDDQEIDLRQNFDDELGFSQVTDDRAFSNVNDAEITTTHNLISDYVNQPIYYNSDS